MKIIHTADVHIGSVFGQLSIEKAKLRQAELIDGFRRLCTYARENDVEAVLIAGDLWDNNALSKGVKHQVLSAIEEAAPVRFFYVSGNHDDEWSTQTDLPSNFYLFGQARGFFSYTLGDVTISGMDTKYFSAENFRALQCDAKKFNVVLLHGDINGVGKESIPLSLLQDKPIDYLALGHIHKPSLSSTRFARGTYRYSGCLEGRGYDEIGPRGFFLFEIENGQIIKEKFYSLSTREVKEIRVDVSGCAHYADLQSRVFSALENIEEKHLIKVVLVGEYSIQFKKELALLQEKLNTRFFHVKIEDESRLSFHAERYQDDHIISAFIKEVEKHALTDKQRADVFQIGIQALRGEEIEV